MVNHTLIFNFITTKLCVECEEIKLSSASGVCDLATGGQYNKVMQTHDVLVIVFKLPKVL